MDDEQQRLSNVVNEEDSKSGSGGGTMKLQADTCAGLNPAGLPFSSRSKAVIRLIISHCSLLSEQELLQYSCEQDGGN